MEFNKSNQSGYLKCFDKLITTFYDMVEEMDCIELTNETLHSHNNFNLCGE